MAFLRSSGFGDLDPVLQAAAVGDPQFSPTLALE